LQLLIASDIFGRTADLEALADQLAQPNVAPLLVDPYGGEYRTFDTEAAAYAAFQREVGLGCYVQILKNAVAAVDGPLTMVGFSVGAAAVWALSDTPNLHPKARAFCFYGSQIRHLATVVPRIAIELFFPDTEPYFDVSDLMAGLSRNGVVCHQTSYLHGFMNPLSVNFDAKAYAEYLLVLEDRLRA